jgi:geranylgeranyl reductase family protein
MKSAKYKIKTDVAIIGAGPAGSALSILLSQKGINHILFEKESFPRDKICGDGLSGKVVSYLKKIDPSIIYELEADKNRVNPSWGVRFVAPNGKGVDIPFYLNHEKKDHAPGYVIKRFDFDEILYKRVKTNHAKIKDQTEVKTIQIVNDNVLLEGKNADQTVSCQAKMVIGAEGDRSIVAKKLANLSLQPEHYFAGLRTYYENVTGMHEQNYIELHFIRDLLPGYFWIFPLPNNQANVGLGVLTNHIKTKNINLKKTLLKIINENEHIKSRFKNARLIDEPKGWGLPLGSLKRPLSGERFLLIGDAGALIDPLTGEGVGNALQSATVASEIILEAVGNGDFSATMLQQYDQRLYDELWDELRLSANIRRLVQMPWLFNFVFNRFHKNKGMQDLFSGMLNDIDLRAKLWSPSFYMKILFNRE